VVDHDTQVLSQTRTTTAFRSPFMLANGDTGPMKITMTNSVWAWSIADPEARVILGDGSLTVDPDNGTHTLDVYCPSGVDGGWTFDGNVVINGLGPTNYPPNSAWVADVDAIGFVDAANADWRLDPTSDYKGSCADGSDPGVDMDTLEFATGGVAP
jgi:hypothetical protein